MERGICHGEGRGLSSAEIVRRKVEGMSFDVVEEMKATEIVTVSSLILDDCSKFRYFVQLGDDGIFLAFFVYFSSLTTMVILRFPLASCTCPA